MFGMKLTWYRLFENRQELEDFFGGKNVAVHHSMFGEVLLVKHHDKFYAFKNKCPHQGKPLNDCRIENDEVVCPFHQYHYSMETGRGQGLYLEKYELKIDDEGFFVGKEKWSWL